MEMFIILHQSRHVHACDTIMLVNTLMSVRREFELF